MLVKRREVSLDNSGVFIGDVMVEDSEEDCGAESLLLCDIVIIIPAAR